MNFSRIISTAAVMMITIFFLSNLYAYEQEDNDRTLSPYFFVKSDDSNIEQMPLKSTYADVVISGVIADVKVTQVYRNEGKRAIEAVYIFPASTRAAVYGMKMTIGKRTVEARIKKRDDARKEYEQAKSQGRSASLLEQQRPNVFQMNVANILPGDTVTVELKYTEVIIPEDKIYEFVYPTVVGPRYSNRPENQAADNEKWVRNPYLRQGSTPLDTFQINVRLNAGMPVRQVTCTTHNVSTSFQGKNHVRIDLDKSESYSGNRDFILQYRLDGDKINSGLLLSEGTQENFFLLTIEPPKRVMPSSIPGREYIFIIDVSGSMHGFPLDITKELMRNLFGSLKPTDRFNVMLFSGGSTVMSEESLSASPQNISRAISMIDSQRGGGGTELLPALKRALALKKARGFSRTVVIATDGYVTVEEEAFDLIRNNLGNANMFAFGIGSSVNRHIIEGMAHTGMGEPFIVEKPENAAAKAESLRKMISSPVLTGVKVEYTGFDVYDVEPASIPDVLSDRPVTIFGKWRGNPQGYITLRGLSGNDMYSERIDVINAAPDRSEALKYLWARQRMRMLSDYNMLRSDDSRISEITSLGLKYNLLSAYTSFVAIDSEIRNKTGKSSTVNQPLPLPYGVSEYAVGQAACKSYGGRSVNTLTAESVQSPSADYVNRADGKIKKEVSSLVIKGIKISGEASESSVRKTVQSNLNTIENCVSGIAPGESFRVVLHIETDGTISSMELKADATSISVQASNCLKKTIKKWAFSRSSKRSIVTITFKKAG